MRDLISRQAAIDVTWFEPSYTDPLNVLTEVRDRLKALPSAQRTGRWIDKIYGCKECSECGYIWLDFGCTNYCPKCGARMDGDEDEID